MARELTFKISISLITIVLLAASIFVIFHKNQSEVHIKVNEIDKNIGDFVHIVPTADGLNLLGRVICESENHTWGEIVYLYDLDENLNVGNGTYVEKFKYGRVTDVSTYGENIYLSSNSYEIAEINAKTHNIEVYNMSVYGIDSITATYPFDSGVYIIGRNTSNNSTYIFFFDNFKFENPRPVFNLSSFSYYIWVWKTHFVDDENGVYLACELRGMDENQTAERLSTYVFLLSKDGKMIKYYRVEKSLDYFFKRGNNLFLYCREIAGDNRKILFIINLDTGGLREVKLQNSQSYSRFLYDYSSDILWLFSAQYDKEKNLTYLRISHSSDGINFAEGFSYKFRGYVEMIPNLMDFQSTIYENAIYLFLYSQKNMVVKIYPCENMLLPYYDWFIWYVIIPLVAVDAILANFFLLNLNKGRKMD